MKNRFQFKLMLASMVIAAGAAMAANTNPAGGSNDAQIAQKVVHEIRMYPRYTMWDNISVRVHDGDVDLQGQLSLPFKKVDLGRIAQRISGVRSVTNEIEVLPNSFFDDRIRLAVARAIYRDPCFRAMGFKPCRPSTSLWTTAM